MIRRVLMTADAVGGVWTYALDLARYLSEQGIQVAVATMGSSLTSDQVADAASVPGLRIFQSEFKLEWMESPWSDVGKAGSWLLSVQDAFRPDVIHLNGFCHGALPWSAPTVMVCHSCVCSWWDSVKGFPAGSDWLKYRSEVTRGLRSADLVVAPTRAMLDTALKLYGPFKQTEVIPNGRDSFLFRPAIKENFVFSAGRIWDEAKNIASLEKAAGDLEWPVYVAGGGAADVDGPVRFLGRLVPGEIAEWLSRAAIYALPARYEPFGLSILEAALSGCALVLGDIESLRENWLGCASFVDPNDTGALRQALRELIHDEQRRKELAAAARARAESFSLTNFGERYLNAYRQLVDPHRGESSPVRGRSSLR